MNQLNNTSKLNLLDLDQEREIRLLMHTHPNIAHVVIDIESILKNGTYIPTNIAVIDHQSGKTLMLRSILYEGSTEPQSNQIPLKEVLRELKIYLKNRIVVMWNSEEDLKKIPQIERYCLGVHCGMTRFSRVMNPHFNELHNDRPFLKLPNAMKQIGDSLENWHDPVEDSKAASVLWHHCDVNNFPRDPEISKLIQENINTYSPFQLFLEFSDDDIHLNYSACQRLKEIRAAFRKPDPFYFFKKDLRRLKMLHSVKEA